jgi:hypothetical protein
VADLAQAPADGRNAWAMASGAAGTVASKTTIPSRLVTTHSAVVVAEAPSAAS